ncbi:MAG: hypothetical protein JW995_01545 [Melioribacteraceae bacterium]|nr:hypothetical protein [Melioribacteraceae bacterium]
MNTNTKLLVLIFILMFNYNYFAQNRNLGLGVILGEPTGLSGKYWLNENNAFDFAFGYTVFGTSNYVALHADYLYHSKDLIKSEIIIPVYYGFGIRLRSHSGHEDSFGVRGVAGISHTLSETPLGFFIEAAPVFQLFPETKLKFDAALGARYYFKL